MEAKEFKKYIFDNLHKNLLNAGFEQSKSQIYSKKISEDVLGTVGIGQVIKHKGAYIAINPIIGVRSLKLEQFLSKLKNSKYDKFTPATISSPIGYLKPQKKYKQYIFTLDQIDKSNKNNNEWNAGAMSTQFGNNVNQRITCRTLLIHY